MSNLQNGFMSKFDLTMPQFNILRILRGANQAINVNTVKERMIEKSPMYSRQQLKHSTFSKMSLFCFIFIFIFLYKK